MIKMEQSFKKHHAQEGTRLASQMSLPEMMSQLKSKSRGIQRLSVLPYNWWNECLHGVARAGTATVFPQAICMAATFSEETLFHTAQLISTEARAKFNESQKKGDYGIYKGLTMWSPNINIYRDPRWGRGQETYGEDPYLTGLLGTAFIKGLQGDHPSYIKTAACAKHFAVHSGPEAQRHAFNAVISKKDLFETYLPAFKKAVTDGKVCGIMGAYNRVNGEACCASEHLIQKLLRSTWGFDGYFVSDCGALCDIVKHHRFTKNPLKGAAMAINAGCELECGRLFRFLPLAYAFGYVSKETLRSAAARLLSVRSSLGMLDEKCPYHTISPNQYATPSHEAFAVKTAEKGIVLLENNGILPLKKNGQKILVAGYNAENDLAYLGNYFGEPREFIKILKAVKQKNSLCAYAQGYSYKEKENTGLQKEAVAKANDSDVVIVCTGLDCSMEGEEAGELLKGGGGVLGKQGDRQTLDLPLVQQELLDNLMQTGKRLIILNFSGGCMDFRKYAKHADAILQCWYPGARGGEAIANLLFGDASPSGKLPLTFYNSTADLPPFEDYSMEQRTYRYFTGNAQYRFGYGLTYTQFELVSSERIDQDICCVVKNTGSTGCDEVLQLYVTLPQTEYQNPIRSLIQVKRVFLPAGAEKEIHFKLEEQNFYSTNESGDTVLLSGCYRFYIADGQSIDSQPLAVWKEGITKIIEKCPL